MKSKFFYKDTSAPKPNKPNHIGVAAIIKCKDKVLLEKRADCERWSLIGGGLKIDETLADCLKREVFEETHLEISDYKFIDILDDPSRIAQYPDGNVLRIVTVLFSIEIDNINKPVTSDESLELRFCTTDELREIDIVETHRHIVNDYILKSI